VGPHWTVTASSAAAGAGLALLMTRRTLMPGANPALADRSEAV
jgi:hypothetical protein